MLTLTTKHFAFAHPTYPSRDKRGASSPIKTYHPRYDTVYELRATSYDQLCTSLLGVSTAKCRNLILFQASKLLQYFLLSTVYLPIYKHYKY